MCCPTLIVVLENDAKEAVGTIEGVYTFRGFSDGMDYWVNAEEIGKLEKFAIWYKASGSGYYWGIGYLGDLESNIYIIYSSSSAMQKEKCPNNEGDALSWKFFDGSSWIVTNDVYIKCANENDFCTSGNPCGTNQGDCDTHDECQLGLVCGSNNCPDSLGSNSEFDCCYEPAPGDVNFCTTDNPCGMNEGDCDSNNECQTNLICDTTNDCSGHLGFASDVNCCISGCPAGYIEKTGDIIGNGMEHETALSIEVCANRCSSNDDCCVFLYSISGQMCQLHEKCAPNANPYADYVFCQKGCKYSIKNYSCIMHNRPRISK